MTNMGNVLDAFDLQVVGNKWVTLLDSAQLTLSPAAAALVTVMVDVPGDAAHYEKDVVAIIAVSQGNGTASDSVSLTTTAVWDYLIYLPVIQNP
jgi:hypothetical protein